MSRTGKRHISYHPNISKRRNIWAHSSNAKKCISVISNISEGIGRSQIKETIQFLNFAKGSLFELDAQLTISFDLNYIDSSTYERISNLILECNRLVQGFSNYCKKKINTTK